MPLSDPDPVKVGIELLRGPERPWTTLSGHLLEWYDELALEIGRYRMLQDHSEHHDTDDGAHPQPPSDEVETTERESRFWTTLRGQHIRIDRIREHPEPDDPEQRAPDILVVRGRKWWTLRGDSYDSGSMPPDRIVVESTGERWAVYGEDRIPDPQDWQIDPGVPDLDTMLRPVALLDVLRFVSASAPVVDGRRAIRAEAVPRYDVHGDVDTPGLIVPGASRYVMDIDRDTGVLLVFQAYISDRLAQHHRMFRLSVNPPLKEDLFTSAVPG